jgi:hypothetical protein
MRRLVALLILIAIPALASAHHSFSEFDQSRTILISGTLTDYAWQNPHVKLKVEADLDGKTVTWDVECHSIGILSRAAFDPNTFKVGDKVSVAGTPSRATPNRMFATNVLLPSGREVVLAPGVPPRWQTTAAPLAPPGPPPGATVEPPTKGLFKVWGSSFADPRGGPAGLWMGMSPSSLTPAAKSALASWDPIHDTVARGCEPKGMPTIMEQPYGLAFEDHGATITLKLEEYDTLRTIHVSDGAAVPAAKSLLGYSVGRWDGSTLVVTTTGISWRYVSPDGLPLGPSARLEERFTPADDGKRLDYTVTITDPDTFTKPVALERFWVWSPTERVRPYECGQRQSTR